MIGLKRPQRKDRRPGTPVDEAAFVGMAAENVSDQEPGTALVAIDRARQALEIAGTLGEVKELRSQAEAMRIYAKQAKCSLEVQNMCAELKLRAERKAGAMLGDLTVKGGERHKSHDATYERVSILEELGISKTQSSRWQTIAALPEQAFEAHLTKVKLAAAELTTASLMRLSTILKRQDEDPAIAQGKSNTPVHHGALLTSQDFWDALAIMRSAIDKAREDNWQTIPRDTVIDNLQGLIDLVRSIDVDLDASF